MTCPYCGAEIPAGALFCVTCGKPAPQQPQASQQSAAAAAPQQPQAPQQPSFAQPQQPQAPQQPSFAQPQQPQAPQQPSFAQPQQPQAPQQPGGYAQPQQPGGFGQPQPGAFGQPQPGGFQKAPTAPIAAGGGINAFLGRLKAEPIRFTEPIGLLFIFLSTLIPTWITVSAFGFKESAGLFGSGGIWPLVGICFFLLTIAQALIMLDVIPPISFLVAKVKALPFSQFYVVGFVFIFWVIYFLASVGSVEKGAYYSIGFGFSFWFCLLGIILMLIVPIMKLIKKENYYA